MGILMKNGVSYSAPYAGYTKTLKEKLVAGETSVTFVDNCITDNVTVDWEVSKFGLVPTDKIEGNHSLTFVFPAQSEDIWVKATFSSISSNSEVPSNKMVFLKATGAQWIELEDITGSQGFRMDFYGYMCDFSVGSQTLFGTTWSRDCLMLSNSVPSNNTIGIEWERSGATDTLTVPTNKPVHFIFDTSGLIMANEQKITFTPTSYSNNTLKLFSAHQSTSNAGPLWMSRTKIYQNNVLVKDLLPTKIGGVACFYDLISKKPYFSGSSTPFQLEEIEYEPTPCISVTNQNTTTTIPMKFTTGNENYVLKTKLYLSSTFVNNNPEGTMYLGSAWNGNSNLIGTDHAGYISIYPSNRDAINLADIKDRWIDIEINQAEKYAKFDGITYNNTWVNSQNYFSFYGKSNSGVPAFYGAIQIYKDNELVANLIPSVNSNGVGYFHDTITQNDYMSTGSQSFGYACF